MSRQGLNIGLSQLFLYPNISYKRHIIKEINLKSWDNYLTFFSLL